jgi:hypothetical protein
MFLFVHSPVASHFPLNYVRSQAKVIDFDSAPSPGAPTPQLAGRGGADGHGEHEVGHLDVAQESLN